MRSNLRDSSEPEVLDQFIDDSSQPRDYGLFEPWMLSHPDWTPPTWMRQREESRAVFRKRLYGLRQGTLPPNLQIMSMGVLTDQERQLEVGKVLQQAFVPERRTFRPRRLIPAAFSRSWITKSDGDNRHLRCIVEDRAVQLQPLAQAVAACVIPRYPTAMDFAPGRLSDDQESSGDRHLENGSGAQRQFALADPTSTNFTQQARQGHSANPRQRSAM